MMLLCLSDIHGEGAGLAEVLADPLGDGRTLRPGADAIVIAGDITHLGGYAEAEAVFAPLLASGITLIAVAGNMDGEGARRYLEEKTTSIHGRGITIGQVGFMGLGGSSSTPFGTPFEVATGQARNLLSTGLADIAAAEMKVLVSHAPPRGTRIDRSFGGVHAGSAEVRDFLLAGSVDLCICGHIHESAGEDILGGARCVNVGAFKNGRYALLAIEGSRVQVVWRKR